MTDSDIYPNADATGETEGSVSRRLLLAESVVAGTAVTAGCLGQDDENETTPAVEERPTVYVFNTGNGSVSLIDVENDEVVETAPIGMAASFPSNQFSPGMTDSAGDPLWLNVNEGVRALSVDTLSERTHSETGSGANWQERTPGGEHLVVSAREPAHRQLRLDADPESAEFGTVTGEIERALEGGRGENDGPGPCDVTIHPDGEFAYVPDLFGDTLTVLSVDPFEIHHQIEVADRDGDAPKPWMGTAAWDGETLLIENNDGATGSESIWDLSTPGQPEEVAHLTVDDGFGEGPLTSEIGPASETGYVFTPGTEDVTVVDLVDRTVVDRLALGGQAFVGTWDPAREKLYVPVQTAGEVAVIDHERREITTRIDVGPEPYGATSATVRPESVPEEATNRLAALSGEYETTYCLGECACGHQW